MKISTILIIAAIVAAGCRNNGRTADAYGNFETTEVIVSSETNGRIVQFEPAEGNLVEKGSTLAIIDTTILILQKAEISAGLNSVKSRLATFDSQNEILKQQIRNLEINITRIENMLREDAATQKQYDDLTGQKAVIEKQISANNSQKLAIASESLVYESKLATLNEQIFRSKVKSPIKGTIIEKYSEMGEITAAGKPVVKIADLSVMRLKAYVSGAQLGSVRIGSECTVRIDNGEKGFTTLSGRISHINEKAEFTPKIIQTKEERVTLVYAVKIDIANDGSIKSGMPGEVIF